MDDSPFDHAKIYDSLVRAGATWCRHLCSTWNHLQTAHSLAHLMCHWLQRRASAVCAIRSALHESCELEQLQQLREPRAVACPRWRCARAESEPTTRPVSMFHVEHPASPPPTPRPRPPPTRTTRHAKPVMLSTRCSTWNITRPASGPPRPDDPRAAVAAASPIVPRGTRASISTLPTRPGFFCGTRAATRHQLRWHSVPRGTTPLPRSLPFSDVPRGTTPLPRSLPFSIAPCSTWNKSRPRPPSLLVGSTIPRRPSSFSLAPCSTWNNARLDSLPLLAASTWNNSCPDRLLSRSHPCSTWNTSRPDRLLFSVASCSTWNNSRPDRLAPSFSGGSTWNNHSLPRLHPPLFHVEHHTAPCCRRPRSTPCSTWATSDLLLLPLLHHDCPRPYARAPMSAACSTWNTCAPP